MPILTVTVGSAVGLHARPASLIAQTAGGFDTDVMLSTPGGEPIAASSALLTMTLGARKGDTVEVSGEDADAVSLIAGMVERDLDAPA